MNYREELEAAFEAAEKAGEIIDEAAGSDFRGVQGTEAKENVNDLVTEADRRSQEAVVKILDQSFPEDDIVGEESPDQGSSSSREWIIDPIDGTANFSTSLPYYCVSIAFRESGEEKAAVVYSPDSSLGKTWYAAEGEGAFVNDESGFGGEKISVSSHDGLEGATVFSRLSERSGERRDVEQPIVMELLEEGIRYRRTASAAINLAMVAEGVADGLGYIALGDYDVAAGTLLVEEAGGDVRLEESDYGKDYEIIASNGEIQEELEEIFDRNTV
jgi:myo-inositol-1(or 4)-monophosphatase